MISLIRKLKKIIKNFIYLEKYIDETTRFELLKQDYEKEILKFQGDSILNYKAQDIPQIIVSLTTYGKRIYDVHLTIESLFRQTIKPSKIILWLAENEFNQKNIPCMLKNLQRKGLEIGFCKDLKSYKKLIPTLKKYPDDVIITVDDDIIYSFDLIEKLIHKHEKNKTSIIASRAHKYKLKSEKEFFSYNKWEKEVKEDKNLFLTSGAGTLFPPKVFDKDFFDISKIFELSPFADDIWINAMLLKNNKKIILIDEERKYLEKHVLIKTGQDIALHLINLGQSRNDTQLKSVFDYYNLWIKLKEKK